LPISDLKKLAIDNRQVEFGKGNEQGASSFRDARRLRDVFSNYRGRAGH
jgi:hypothetical protein